MQLRTAFVTISFKIISPIIAIVGLEHRFFLLDFETYNVVYADDE